jgi:hypothetical protein
MGWLGGGGAGSKHRRKEGVWDEKGENSKGKKNEGE